MPADRPNKKRKFSSFTKPQAFELLQLRELLPWDIATDPVPLSPFFQERWARLWRNFDLESYEESKKLLIDALCDEALNPLDRLKIWKGAKLEGRSAIGYVDYLIAEQRRYLTTPLLCVIEAKKDNFEQGLAQCLVELEACTWQNQRQGRDISVFGIVTNGEGWRFYRLDPQPDDRAIVYETPLYSTGDMENLLGRLRQVFRWCAENLPI
ncbi:MAG: hypothetical protein ACO4CG_04370 [Prochlorothrix sp.]